MLNCGQCNGNWNWIEKGPVWFGNMHVDGTPPVLADEAANGGLNFVMGSDLNAYVQDSLIPDLFSIGKVYTHEGQTGSAQFMYNYFMSIIGGNVDPDIVYGILIAKDGEQGTEHDPGGLLRRQLAIDTVDCNGVFYCGDYIVEDVFFVDEPPYAPDEFADDPDSEYIWPWPQYCQPLKADGFAAGEYSCWILGIPTGYYLVYPKVKVRLKDDINNWRRFTVYEYDTADFWIQPPDEGASFYFGDLVEFYPNFDPTSLDPLKPYTNWLPVDADGNERLPYSEDPINGYKSIIHTPPIGPNFSITSEDDDFWVKAYYTYCLGQQQAAQISCVSYIQGQPAPPPQPSISFDEECFRVGTYDSLAGPYTAHRQYVNMDKLFEGGRPVNYDDWIPIRVEISNFDPGYWVYFYYLDIPIQPQSDPPFPWNPNWPPEPGGPDNLGAGDGYVDGPGPAHVQELYLSAAAVVEATFYTSHFGGDNYQLYVILYDREPHEQGAQPLCCAVSPAIEVWRRYVVDVTTMDNLEPGPDYWPDYTMVPDKFKCGYVQFANFDEEYSLTLEAFKLDAGDDGEYARSQEPGKILDYVDDLELGNDYFNPAVPYHIPPLNYCSRLHHAHVQGIKDFWQDMYGINSNFFGDPPILYQDHVHSYIAVYTILAAPPLDPPPDPPISNQTQLQKVVCHELGHALAGLNHPPGFWGSIMHQGFLINIEHFKFNGDQTYKLRRGPYFDEFGSEGDCYE